MNSQGQTLLEVVHYQDQVKETFLDQSNRKVIELYHRSGGRRDRIVHSADNYLQKFANYPIGKRVLYALVMN